YPTARDTAQALHDWLAVNGGEAWAKMNSLGGHSSIMGSSVFVTGPGGSGANPGQSTAITSVPVAASPTVPIKSAAAETVADQDANLASFFSALRGGDAAAPAAPSSAPLVAAAAAPAAAVAIARPVAPAVPVAQAVATAPAAIPVAQAVPVAVPVAQPVAAPQRSGKGKGKKAGLPKNKIILAAGGGAALLIVAVIYFAFGSKSSPKTAAKGTKTKPAATTGKGTEGTDAANAAPPPLKRELTVGPSGEFKTINA